MSKSEPSKFPLTQLERRGILNHNLMPIVRDDKPALEQGSHVIVRFSPERRHCDPETGQVFTVPKKPMVWITVTKVTRRTKGGWAVRYDITDLREQAWMLAPGSGYTTDPAQAIDRGEVPLSDTDRARMSADARATHAERVAEDREKSERLARAQIRSMSEMLRGMAADAARQGTTIDLFLARLAQQIQAESKKAA